MVAIVRTMWSGTSGGPGLTQLALLGPSGGIWAPGVEQQSVDAVRKFWDSLKLYLPNELKLTVSPTVDSYDRATGDLIGSDTAVTAPGVVSGTSASAYAAAAGLKITWNTGQIRDGRRVRGTTFIVPAAQTVYSDSGTIIAGAMTAVNLASATLISDLATAGTSLAVWSRPRVLPEARAGMAYQVSSGSCSSKTAILRGRRD